MANGQNGSDAAAGPPQEQKYGHRVELWVRGALAEAGAGIKEQETLEERERLDQKRKVDILITRIPGLPYPDQTIALQVTTDSRVGRKLPTFLGQSATVSIRKAYIRIREPNGTLFDKTFGETLLTIFRSWILNAKSAKCYAVAITIFQDLTYTLQDLEDLVNGHAARIAETEGAQLLGNVSAYIGEKEFGFVDCRDPQLVDSKEEQGDFQFFFKLSDCAPDIMERLRAGEVDIKVTFVNGGYDSGRIDERAPRARKLELYVPPAIVSSDATPPPDPEALRAWMQSVYDAIDHKTLVTPPPTLSLELWRALREYGYYPLRLPTLGPDDPLPIGFTQIPGWTRGKIIARWVAVETVRAYPDTSVKSRVEVESIAPAVRELSLREYRSRSSIGEDSPPPANNTTERYPDDRLVKAIGLNSRLGISTDQLYGTYLNRIAEKIGTARTKVQLLTAEEWVFVADLLNWIRENCRENLPNLFHPCNVLELLRNIDPGNPGLKSAIGNVKNCPSGPGQTTIHRVPTLSFTRLQSYEGNNCVAFRTLIELE